jgi:hypothetical protein
VGYDGGMDASTFRNACGSLMGAAVLAVSLLALPAVSQADPLSAPVLDRGPLLSPQPAPPTAAQIARAPVMRPDSDRKVFVRTTDRAPGGYLEADVSWSGSGPYSGKVYGSAHDTESDGYCVGAWVWLGSGIHPRMVRHFACPKGEAQTAYYSYIKKWRVLVDVCLVKAWTLHYCSDWK